MNQLTKYGNVFMVKNLRFSIFENRQIDFNNVKTIVFGRRLGEGKICLEGAKQSLSLPLVN